MLKHPIKHFQYALNTFGPYLRWNKKIGDVVDELMYKPETFAEWYPVSVTSKHVIGSWKHESVDRKVNQCRKTDQKQVFDCSQSF